MLALSLSVCLTFISNAVRDDFPKVPGALVFDGSHSQIKKETIRLIRTAEEWKKTWAEHRGEPNEPKYSESWQMMEVDFDTHCVVAVFVGCVYSCTAKPHLRDGAVVIRFTANGVQTEGRPFGGSEPTAEEKWAAAKNEARRSYAFVILPRSEKPIIVEEGRQRNLISPYVWIPRVTFAAPLTKK